MRDDVNARAEAAGENSTRPGTDGGQDASFVLGSFLHSRAELQLCGQRGTVPMAATQRK